jgi:predicted metal-dependent hydrolase
MIDPNKYTIRESLKAKNVSLKLSIEKGLEIVIPRGYDRRQIPIILQKKQTWLHKATQKIEKRLQEKQQLLQANPPNILPDRIYFTPITEEWQVSYPFLGTSTAIRATWYEKSQNQLIINGNIPEVCRIELKQWLIAQAQQKLIPILEDVSKSIKLPFRKVTIRNQKTLWASCSSRKDISLNCKLLFLSNTLVRYVCIHELCHTVHMNHSSKFWNLVQTKEPDFKQLDQQLNDVWRIIPTWVT